MSLETDSYIPAPDFEGNYPRSPLAEANNFIAPPRDIFLNLLTVASLASGGGGGSTVKTVEASGDTRRPQPISAPAKPDRSPLLDVGIGKVPTIISSETITSTGAITTGKKQSLIDETLLGPAASESPINTEGSLWQTVVPNYMFEKPNHDGSLPKYWDAINGVDYTAWVPQGYGGGYALFVDTRGRRPRIETTLSLEPHMAHSLEKTGHNLEFLVALTDDLHPDNSGFEVIVKTGKFERRILTYNQSGAQSAEGTSGEEVRIEETEEGIIIHAVSRNEDLVINHPLRVSEGGVNTQTSPYVRVQVELDWFYNWLNTYFDGERVELEVRGIQGTSNGFLLDNFNLFLQLATSSQAAQVCRPQDINFDTAACNSPVFGSVIEISDWPLAGQIATCTTTVSNPECNFAVWAENNLSGTYTDPSNGEKYPFYLFPLKTPLGEPNHIVLIPGIEQLGAASASQGGLDTSNQPIEPQEVRTSDLEYKVFLPAISNEKEPVPSWDEIFDALNQAVNSGTFLYTEVKNNSDAASAVVIPLTPSGIEAISSDNIRTQDVRSAQWSLIFPYTPVSQAPSAPPVVRTFGVNIVGHIAPVPDQKPIVDLATVIWSSATQHVAGSDYPLWATLGVPFVDSDGRVYNHVLYIKSGDTKGTKRLSQEELFTYTANLEIGMRGARTLNTSVTMPDGQRREAWGIIGGSMVAGAYYVLFVLKAPYELATGVTIQAGMMMYPQVGQPVIGAPIVQD